MSVGAEKDADSSGGKTGVLNRLLLVVGLRPDPSSGGKHRAWTLAGLLALCFAASGVVRDAPGVSFIIDPPFNLDWALRTVTLGWYQPRGTLPVTIVDIDEKTYQAWRSPAITPRNDLARLVKVVTDAGPSAVVIDIDLSGVDDDADPDDDQQLENFLEQYRGAAPLIFPKRIEPGEDGGRRMAPSRYDELFERNERPQRNERLQWAHASFSTDDDGAVRYWVPWIAVCGKGASSWLPAVATRVANALALPTAAPVFPEPATKPDCRAADPELQRRLLVGPRLTGPSKRPLARDARSVSAAQLLDPEIARDDEGLFGGRVVLIGATHSGSGDFWTTPGGVMPGVELLTNAVHYAPIKAGEGRGAELAFRALAILLFLAFVYLGLKLRGLVAFFAGMAFALAVVAIAIRGFGNFRVFESLQSAIVLTVLYAGMRSLFDLVEEFLRLWREVPAVTRRWNRFWRTFGKVCRLPESGG